MGKKIKDTTPVGVCQTNVGLVYLVRLIKAVQVIDKCKYNSRDILFERLARCGLTQQQAEELLHIYNSIKQ